MRRKEEGQKLLDQIPDQIPEDEGEQVEVVWTCHKERPGVCRKKDERNEVTGKGEKREAEEKISGCSNRGYGGSWCEGEEH